MAAERATCIADPHARALLRAAADLAAVSTVLVDAVCNGDAASDDDDPDSEITAILLAAALKTFLEHYPLDSAGQLLGACVKFLDEVA